jgi:two-component system chemotaxis response regulator CheB
MHPGMIVMGGSAGGMAAVEVILQSLPEGFTIPVAIVLHRSKGTSGTDLVSLLGRKSVLHVIEISDKEPIVSGTVFLGPADYHLMVEGDHFALSTEELHCYSRPSIDILFETASDCYGDRLVGVVLTGANADGSRGLKVIKDNGGMAVVQDPDTAESRRMPEAAMEATKVDRVLPVEQIGLFISTLGAK